jgi:nucleoid DNA-binding protein
MSTEKAKTKKVVAPKVTTDTIVKDIMEATKFPKDTVKAIMSAEKKAVATHVGNGEAVQLTGYFTASPIYRAAREANDISKKAKNLIPETVGVSIKGGTELKSAAAKLDPVYWRPTEVED